MLNLKFLAILKPKNDDQLEFIPTYLSYNLQCSK